MSDLEDLFNDLVIDHSSKPRNFRKMDDASCQHEGFNPLCGDQFVVYLKLEGNVVKDISFHGRHQNCALSTASASLMTQLLKGRTRAEAERLFEEFRSFIRGEIDPAEAPELEKLTHAFAAVTTKPIRAKCVTLPWHTFRAALEGASEIASTE